MPSPRLDKEVYRRRRLFAALGVALTLLIILGLRAALATSDEHATADGTAPEGSSAAARSWAQQLRIREADRADRKAIAATLEVTPVLKRASGASRQVALTFDDGPSQYTPEVLDVLDRYEVKATFFVIGGATDAHAELIQNLVARGHVVANHTVNHAALSSLSRSEQAAEIDGQTRAIEMFGAPKPHLFRPPYNAWNETTLGIVERRRMLMVLWSVETHDWARPGVDAIVNNTLNSVEPGAIVLLHDGGGDRSQTVAALPRIIEALQEQDYELVTVPQLLRDGPPTENQG